MKTLRSVIAVFLVVLAAAAPPLAAFDSEKHRATLKGLKTLNVIIEGLDQEIESAGLVASQLRTDVELRLRQSGIQVTAVPSDFQALYVHVNAVGTAARGFAFSVNVVLLQPVSILRTPELTLPADTWSTQMVGLAPAGRFPESVRAAVRDSVDEFINAFLSVNPKP